MSGTISDPGGRGTRATRRRNGSNRMFRKVTVWREGGRALRLPFTTTPNFSYKWLASFALVRSCRVNCRELPHSREQHAIARGFPHQQCASARIEKHSRGKGHRDGRRLLPGG